MSERGNFRGGRGSGGRGRGGDSESSHRGGGGRGGGGRGGGHQQAERPKKENILDLTRYLDKEIGVKFNGGREGEWLERNNILRIGV
jgi:U6 snRNA-associated Sm-like protein LSm7